MVCNRDRLKDKITIERLKKSEYKIGYSDGRVQTLKNIIINLLDKGFKDEEIKDILDITLDELNQLK